MLERGIHTEQSMYDRTYIRVLEGNVKVEIIQGVREGCPILFYIDTAIKN